MVIFLIEFWGKINLKIRFAAASSSHYQYLLVSFGRHVATEKKENLPFISAACILE